jgi:hypothetical protein
MIHRYSELQAPQRTAVAPCPNPVPEPPVTCCEMICFERPRYFCGHLLTDTDLSKEQQYVVEKHKLYHRTLHGHGIVCGLRLTCDPNCAGHVLIGEGYAIDDCGNDLVVCEPQSFDVLGRLRAQGRLVESEPPDPCKPGETPPECKVRQCFYVVACYAEEQTDFTTPFVAGCRPAVSECEPTRIREGVRFDVVAELPKGVSALDALESRVAACTKLFTEGPFAQSLKAHADALTKAVKGEAEATNSKQDCDLFCELRGLLLLYLKRHPDQYNCTIEEDIRDLRCPQESTDHYGTDIQHAFCRLLDLAYQHVVACVFGELIFPCPRPSQASCVVLGTVEVEDGRLIRVCNCPRSYAWSFANFFEVLIATALGGGACEDDERKHTCCREFTLQDCDGFVKLLQANERTMALGSTAPFQAIREVQRSLTHAFDFTRPDIIPSRLFTGMPVERALQVARDLGVPFSIEDQPPQAKVLDLLDAISANVLKTADNPLVAFHSEGRVVAVQPDLQPPMTLSPTERAEFEGRIGEARAMAEAASRHATALQNELAGKQQEITELTNQMQRANDNLRDLQIALGNAQRDIEALRGPTPPSPEGEGEGPESGAPRRRRPR